MSDTQKDFWFTIFWLGIPAIVGAILITILANKATGWVGGNLALVIVGSALGGLLGMIGGWVYLGIISEGKDLDFRSTAVWVGIPAMAGAILVTILANRIADWIGNSVTVVIFGLILGGLLGAIGALLFIIWLLSDDD